VDTNKKDSDHSPASNSATQTIGPNLTPKEGTKNPNAKSVKDSSSTM
jgi:hypothetical protein